MGGALASGGRSLAGGAAAAVAAAVVLLGSFTDAAGTLALSVPSGARCVRIVVRGYNKSGFGQVLAFQMNGDVGPNYDYNIGGGSGAGQTQWPLSAGIPNNESFRCDLEMSRVSPGGVALTHGTYRWQADAEISSSGPLGSTVEILTGGVRTIDEDLASIQIVPAGLTYTADVFAEVGA